MKGKEKKIICNFKAPESLLKEVQNKIDKENAKAKDRSQRTSMSGKMRDLLYEYVSR